MSEKIRFVELQDLCISITDCHHSTPLYTEKGKIVIRNFNIKNGRLILDDISYTDDENYYLRTSRAIPEAGDLIITREAPMGEVCIVPENLECCLGQRMVLLKSKQHKVDLNYLLYALMSQYVQTQIFKSEGTGSIVSNLRIPVLKELHIPIYDIEHQKTIGKILRDIDSKISLNNRINAELEAMAKTIYDYWFVQFDFPNAEGKPYKSSGGKMVWSEELKREVPEGWEVGMVGQIADLIRGVSYDSKSIKCENDENVIPILRATNITTNVIDLDNMVYVPEDFVSDKQILNEFDILMTMSSGSKEHIGKNGFYYFKEKVSFGAFCAKLVAKNNFKFYLYSYMQSDFMFQSIKNECLGTNINNLNGGIVNGFKLIIPTNEVLEKFNNIVESIYRKVGNNQQENQHLSSLRDWLLPMLMNGQVVSTTLNNREEEWYSGIAAEPGEKYEKQ